jgi:AcrR family transcriptional regulator
MDKSNIFCFNITMKKSETVRPGGRSQRVKSAVFAATEAMMVENPHSLPSMGEIAARAGVNPTSLYRRWGTVSRLVTDVAIEQAMRDFPVPDTGTLRGDLTGWADVIARRLGKPDSTGLFRALAANVGIEDKHLRERIEALARRGDELNIVLDRAKARGEPAPALSDVLEVVAAPIYFHVLFFGPVQETGYAARLVDRLLTLASRKAK